MLFSLFLENPILGVLIFLSLVVAIGLHEAAHAFTAIKLGDDTPKLQHRNTINPIRHLDPVGTLMLVFAGIGWGKAVQFNPFNLKNPRKDAMKIALAGPLTNILIAVFAVVLLVIIKAVNFSNPIGLLLSTFLTYLMYLNVVLAVFNLLPFEPLDGFKVVNGLLPHKLSLQWQETQRYGMYVLLVFLITGAFGRIMDPIINVLMAFVTEILKLV